MKSRWPNRSRRPLAFVTIINSLLSEPDRSAGRPALRLPGEIRLRASVARSYRAPTFNDLYWPASAFVAGNPNLQPEKAWSYELGGEKKFGDLAIFKVAGFYRDVTDLILWAPGTDFVWRPTNVQTAHIWGGGNGAGLLPVGRDYPFR